MKKDTQKHREKLEREYKEKLFSDEFVSKTTSSFFIIFVRHFAYISINEIFGPL